MSGPDVQTMYPADQGGGKFRLFFADYAGTEWSHEVDAEEARELAKAILGSPVGTMTGCPCANDCDELDKRCEQCSETTD